MDQPHPSQDDLTEAEYEALATHLGDQEEMTVQFAVVYYRRGELVAEGPFSRSVAEGKANAKLGVVAERTKQTTYGMWTATDPRFAEFDQATEED